MFNEVMNFGLQDRFSVTGRRNKTATPVTVLGPS